MSTLELLYFVHKTEMTLSMFLVISTFYDIAKITGGDIKFSQSKKYFSFETTYQISGHDFCRNAPKFMRVEHAKTFSMHLSHISLVQKKTGLRNYR